MNRIISLVFLIAGIILILYGVSASESVSSGFSRLFTGAPTDKAIWLMIGGAAAVIMGASGLLLGPKSR